MLSYQWFKKLPPEASPGSPSTKSRVPGPPGSPQWEAVPERLGAASHQGAGEGLQEENGKDDHFMFFFWMIFCDPTPFFFLRHPKCIQMVLATFGEGLKIFRDQPFF